MAFSSSDALKPSLTLKHWRNPSIPQNVMAVRGTVTPCLFVDPRYLFPLEDSPSQHGSSESYFHLNSFALSRYSIDNSLLSVK